MPLSVGDKLGHYEVISLLGQGGMGEVYRATDGKLDRDVAIKVLPQALARDPERLARFEREAKVLASLDHPNIGHIHGIVDFEDSRGLVLALIEGPTLADRIAAGALPPEEAFHVAKQVIEALEYAHDRGVVHRDLKPANVKITPDGVVKVLDFGLAKVLEDEPPSSSSPTNSPTLTMGHTRAGVILGTAAYMSPEQAVGRPVDRRSDIFSFGSVLYEMLTGTRAFGGATTPDVLEAVVKNDPDWSKLPDSTDPAVKKLLRRCLVKDRKRRLQAIGEARLLLDEVGQVPEVAVAVSSRSRAASLTAWLGWILAGVMTLGAGLALWAPWRSETPASPVRFQIAAPQDTVLGDYFVPSPDGQRVVFIARGKDGVNRLWLRSLDTLDARLLPGTDGANGAFWSPDGHWIAFGGRDKLKKIDISGGPPQVLADMQSQTVFTGTWNRDGVILFTTGGNRAAGNGGIRRVSAAGGVPVVVTQMEDLRGENVHRKPVFLPDQRHFIYQRGASQSQNHGIYVGSIDAKPQEQSLKLLLATPFTADFVADPGGTSGKLLFVRDGTLMAQVLDTRALELKGEAVPMAEGVGDNGINPLFGVSPEGVLVYRGGSRGVFDAGQLAWADRSGNIKTVDQAGSGRIDAPVLSPDEATAAFRFATAQGTSSDIWTFNFSSGASKQFTFDAHTDQSPVFSPDGSQIAFASDRDGNPKIYQKPANGNAEEELISKVDYAMPTSWSSDGRWLLFTVRTGKAFDDLWVLSMRGERRAVPLLETPAQEYRAAFSPDMHWIAYCSSDFAGGAVPDVWVRPFLSESAGGSAKVGVQSRVSTNGGCDPRWKSDGKELIYAAPDGNLMSVPITPGQSFQMGGPPHTLFRLPVPATGPTNTFGSWDMTADAKRFLVRIPARETSGTPAVTVVLNWRAGLKR